MEFIRTRDSQSEKRNYVSNADVIGQTPLMLSWTNAGGRISGMLTEQFALLLNTPIHEHTKLYK